MKRVDFIQNKSPRPLIPYKEYFLVDGDLYYFRGSQKSLAHVTAYQKGDIILAIAHEAEANGGMNIGQGAQWLWMSFINTYASNKYVFVQGWNGVYEYVKFEYSPKEGRGDGFWPQLVGGLEKGPNITWHPAGTLEEVLERHLK